MKKETKFITSACAFLASSTVFSCDVTFIQKASPETIRNAINNSAMEEICLRPGLYNFGNETLNIPSGKTLKGLGDDRGDVIITSSAHRMIYIQSDTTLSNFTLQPVQGHTPEFGILSYYSSNQAILGLRLKGAQINLGLNGSSGVTVADTFMSDNGGTPAADPNVWITDAGNIEFLWGALYGSGFHPSGGGDGEIAAYNSNNVSIDGLHVLNSGASAVYFVNCDSCSVKNSTLVSASGWGLDIVQGSDNFIAINNLVQSSRYGGSVFQQSSQSGGTYIGNTFIGNNTGGYASCNAINVIGNRFALTLSGNTATPGPITCTFQ